MRQNGDRHNGGRRPEEILAEIERTRHDMDSTLTAIEHRLTPGQLVDQGIDYLRRSGANEFVQNLGGQVKNNPLPVALVGIGLGWLMASSKQPPQYGSQTGTGSSLSGVGDRARESYDRASGAAQSAKQRLGETASSLRERIGGTTQSVRERAGQLSEQARGQMERGRATLDYMMREQPLALGALGLAVGALFAAMTPRTRREDELMGDARDRLMDQAKEMGKEKLEQGKQVAGAAMDAAKKETGRQTGSESQAGSERQSAFDRPSGAQRSDGPPVGVHHMQGDAPTHTVPPTSTKPTVTAKSTKGNTGGPRNTP